MKEFFAMIKFNLFRMFIVISTVMFASMAFGQGKPYDGPEDPAGDKTAIRKAG